MESDFQGYNMNLDYDVYRYEYPVEIEPGESVNKSVSISLGARVDQMYVRVLDENGNEVVTEYDPRIPQGNRARSGWRGKRRPSNKGWRTGHLPQLHHR